MHYEMARLFFCLGFVVTAFLASNSLQAVEITGKLLAIDPAGQWVTLERSSGASTRSVTLDIQPGTVVGKSLSPGAQIRVDFDPESESITALRPVKPQPEFSVQKLTELEGTFPWFSEDGLTVYWEGRSGHIWTARRDNPETRFANKKKLFAGRHPTVTGDGKEMVFLSSVGGKQATLHVATRENLTDLFTRVKELSELRNTEKPKGPCLALDGLTLFFTRRTADKQEIAYATRPTRNAPWQTPKKLPVTFHGDGFLTWPFVSADGLTMFCSNEGLSGDRKGKNRLMVWSRESSGQPFLKYEYIEIKGFAELNARCPRPVTATSELFFQPLPIWARGQPNHIRVLKNFSLPN